MDLQTSDMFNILQWNAQRITTLKEDLLKIISEQQPNVVAIRETILGGDVAVNISGYNSNSKQGNFNRRYHGGVATYVHESLPVEHIDIVSKYQVVVVKVNIRKNLTITVANIYNIYIYIEEV